MIEWLCLIARAFVLQKVCFLRIVLGILIR
jgi:hypothetical protein